MTLYDLLNGEETEKTYTLLDILNGEADIPVTPVERCIIESIEIHRRFQIELDDRLNMLQEAVRQIAPELNIPAPKHPPKQRISRQKQTHGRTR